jgi:hypothetical protein
MKGSGSRFYSKFVIFFLPPMLETEYRKRINDTIVFDLAQKLNFKRKTSRHPRENFKPG